MQNKPYSEMTEEERKAWFGKAFKRMKPGDVKEAYVCTADPEQFGSGYGVVSKEFDPYGMYDIEELKQYLEDYPEMDCIGWLEPLSGWQKDVTIIRTEWVNKSESDIARMLYESQLYKFIDDDIWNGPAYQDEKSGVTETQWLGVWGTEHLTCDRASQLYSQYVGFDDEKAAKVLTIRNEMKTYCKTLAEKFYNEHYGKPDKPEFERKYYND